MKRTNPAMISIRLDPTLLQRMDKIADRMSQPGMRVTRTEVFRLAAFKGVEQLESEQKKR